MKLNKMREQMAQAFINSLKEDKIPWHKEWSVIGTKPFNGVSDVHYHGINAMWLSFVANDKGYEDPRWYTFKQAQEQGYKVRSGEKGTHIEFWSLYDTETKKKITQYEAKELSENLTPEEYYDRIKPISNTYVVFNAMQIEGVPEIDIEKYQLNTEELISCRDKLIANMEVGFSEGGDRAFYSPASDGIFMPEIERFESEYAYMATFLHEAAHASGASIRLSRDLTGTFGSPEYAKEELRAEIASAFTAQMTGIQYKQNDNMENHKAYVQSWISTLEDNPNELFAAIKDAEIISDYLIEKGEFNMKKNIEVQIENKKFELLKNEIQISYGNRGIIKEGCTLEQSDQYPEIIKSFTNVDEALDELKTYKSTIEEVHGHGGLYYRIQEYYIEENIYDEDGEWKSGGDIWGFSKMPEEKMIELGLKELEQTVQYYTQNLGGTGIGVDEERVIYQNFNEAMKAYLDSDRDGKKIGVLIGEYEPLDILQYDVLIDNDVRQVDYNKLQDLFSEIDEQHLKEIINNMDIINKSTVPYSKQEQAINKVEMLKQSFVEETKENISDWQLGQITSEQMKEMISTGDTRELEYAINELGEAGLVRTEKLRLETLDFVRAFNNSRIVIQNAEKNIDYFPDPKVSIDDMYNYGYTYSEMLPLSKEKAIELQDKGIEIFRLYPDNMEASMEGRSVVNDNNEVMYGIEKESWERHLNKQNEVNMVQDIATVEKLLKLQEDERITEWYGDYNMYEAKLNVSAEQIKSKYEEYSKMVEAYKKIEGVEISNFAIDEDNYIHFTAKAGDYEYDGLYCIHDPANGPDNNLVSIDYGYEDKIFEQQWENIESFLKKYAAPIYSEIQKHEINLFKGADAARLRMALKGNQTSKEVYFSSEKIDENVKQLAFDVGTEAMEYITAGMDIKDVIAYKTKVIDEKLQIGDWQYTKNILCSTFANTNYDYKEFMNNISIIDMEQMQLISKGMASRILETDIPLFAIENGEMKHVSSRYEFENMYQKDYWVDKHQIGNNHDLKPAIHCEWSECSAFDENKLYTVSEFNSIMQKEDTNFVEARTKMLSKYKDLDDLYENGTPEEKRYVGYEKVKFNVNLGKRTITERQDIGDGDGSVVEFLQKVLNDKSVAEELKQAVSREEEFISYISKVKAVYEYERANDIPEDFRVITDDMGCLSKNMLDTQYELISKSRMSGMENIMKSNSISRTSNIRKMDINLGR